jgi:hypothetical protein
MLIFKALEILNTKASTIDLVLQFEDEKLMQLYIIASATPSRAAECK